MDKLISISRSTKYLVARLRCHRSSNRTQETRVMALSMWHFNTSNIVAQTGICVGAHVAISGINIVLEVGLYNGARCKIITILYTNLEGPNNKQYYYLPKYVIVNFPGLQLPNYIDSWDSNNPMVSHTSLNICNQHHRQCLKPCSSMCQ